MPSDANARLLQPAALEPARAEAAAAPADACVREHSVRMAENGIRGSGGAIRALEQPQLRGILWQCDTQKEAARCRAKQALKGVPHGLGRVVSAEVCFSTKAPLAFLFAGS